MGLISAYYRAREQFSIYRFKVTESGNVMAHLIQLALAMRGWLLVAIMILAASSWIDLKLVPAQWPANRAWLSGASAIGSSTQVSGQDPNVFLTASASVSAAVLALLISASMVLLQSAAMRFPANIITFVSEDRIRNALLGLLLVNILFSLGNVVLNRVGVLLPQMAIVVSATLVLGSLAMLPAYLRLMMYLFHPASLALRLSQYTRAYYSRLARNPMSRPGRSVEAHLQKLCWQNVERIRDLVLLLLEKGSYREAAEVVPSLYGIARGYLRCRHRIPARSEWFPIRSLADERAAHDWHLRAIYEQLALGQPQRQDHDRDWFEQDIAHSLQQIGDRALKIKAPVVISSVLLCLRDLAMECIEVQEFEVLARILSVTDHFREGLDQDRFSLGGVSIIEIYLHVADTIQRKKLGCERIETLGQRIGSLERQAIWSANLPRVLTEELLTCRDQLDTEKKLEGRQITTNAWLMDEIRRVLGKKEASLVQQFGDHAIVGLESVIKAGQAAGSPEMAGSAYANLVLLANRSLFHGNLELAKKATVTIAREAGPILKLAAREQKLLEGIFNQMRLVTLRTISDRNLLLAEQFVPALCQAIALEGVLVQRVNPDDLTKREYGPEMPLYLEVILVLGGLAFLASEFSGEPRYLTLAVDELRKVGIQLDIVANTMLPEDDSGPALGLMLIEMGLLRKYDHFFRPILRDINNLPKRWEQQGERVWTGFEVPDHPSAFIRHGGAMPLSISCNDCVEGFLRYVARTLGKSTGDALESDSESALRSEDEGEDDGDQ